MRGKRLPLLWMVGKGWGVHTRGLTVRAGEGEGMEPAVLGADGVGEEWAPAAEVLNAGGRDESQTRCRGSQARPLGVGRVGRFVAGGPGGPQDRGLCLGQGGCPFPTQKRSSPLAGWGLRPGSQQGWFPLRLSPWLTGVLSLVASSHGGPSMQPRKAGMNLTHKRRNMEGSVARAE